MKKLILLLLALPFLLTNCAKESPQPEGPTSITTTYKGEFTTAGIDAEIHVLSALVVVTENSATDWSMSLEVENQAPQVLAATKNGEIIQFTNQTYLGSAVNGKGQVLNNGALLRFSVESTGTTAGGAIGSFLGEKQ